jgi:hypothetical protein
MRLACPKCSNPKPHSHGFYRRSSDSQTIKRWRCQLCRSVFSNALLSPCYDQKKRRLNNVIGKFLSSGLSQRRLAMVLNINRKTVARKLIFLANQAKLRHQTFVQNLSIEEFSHLQLDDLITSHHTKLKPLSVSLVVTKKSRAIVAASLSVIPAFGHLAQISKRKYGPRPNELPKNLHELCKNLSHLAPKQGMFDSDQHHLYEKILPKFFPAWRHQTYKSQRASVAGLGELKSKAFDPLFSINHTLAMLRANINRLFRRTWNTTKKPEMLMHHLWLYIDFHNQKLIKV